MLVWENWQKSEWNYYETIWWFVVNSRWGWPHSINHHLATLEQSSQSTHTLWIRQVFVFVIWLHWSSIDLLLPYFACGKINSKANQSIEDNIKWPYLSSKRTIRSLSILDISNCNFKLKFLTMRENRMCENKCGFSYSLTLVPN